MGLFDNLFGAKQRQTTDQQKFEQSDKATSLFGSSFGNTFGTSTTGQSQVRDPFAPAIPGLVGAAGGITDWMLSPSSAMAYTGPRVAGMSDPTRMGIADLTGSRGTGETVDFLRGTIGGQYLGPGNPYLQQVQDAARARVMPSINSRVSMSGMAPGSSVDQALVAREMTDAMAQPLFQAYEAERGRQMQAAGMLPGIERGLGESRIAAGQLGEGYEQRQMDADRAAFEEMRTAGLRPYAEAAPLLTGIGGVGGSTSGVTSVASAGGGSQTDNRSQNTAETTRGTLSKGVTEQATPSWLQAGLGLGMMGAGLFGGGGPLAGWFGGGGGTRNPAWAEVYDI